VVDVVSGGVSAVSWVGARPGGLGVLATWRDPDGGARLASAGTDGTIRLWDADTAEILGDLRGEHAAFIWTLISWSGPGGVRLAAGGDIGVIQIWDPATMTMVGTPLRAHSSWVTALQTWQRPDGSVRLASAGADGMIRIWDPEESRQLGQPLSMDGTAIWSLAAWQAPDGVRLAAGGDDGSIRIWDPEGGHLVGAPLTGHRGAVWTLAQWADPHGGVRLASGGIDGAIRRWDPVSGTELGTALTGHSGWVTALSMWTATSGLTRLASASADGTIRLWDADSGDSLGEPLPNRSPTLAVWTASDGTARLASPDAAGAMRIWDPDTATAIVEPLSGHTAAVSALASWREHDRTRVAAGGDDGTIRIWDAQTGNAVGSVLIGHTAAVWAIVPWSVDGTWRLASSGDDGTVRLWAPEAGNALIEPMAGHSGWVPAMTTWTTARGEVRLATAGADGTVRVWNPETATAVGAPLRGHAGWVTALTSWLDRDGKRLLASGGLDGTIRLWDPDTGTTVGAPLTGHEGCVRALTSWTDVEGSHLASGGFDGTVRVWDPETRAALGEPMLGHNGRISTLAVWRDADGATRLATGGGDDATVRLWDPGTGRQLGEPLRGHTAGIWSLTAWQEPAGDYRLATGGNDGTICLWDPRHHRALRTIEVGPVTMWGLPDTPAERDLLGRQILAEAIADQLRTPARDTGPTVVSIEGPWGCGKSTLMRLVRKHLTTPSSPIPEPSPRQHTFTIAAALRCIRRHPQDPRQRPCPKPADARAVLTAWFNPWAHQSGQQVWAGLTHTLIEAAAPALYPTEAARERYWFTRNLARLDRYALRRALRRRMISPLLGIALATTALQAALALAALNKPLTIAGHTVTTPTLALTVTSTLILIGAAHTATRHRWGRAANCLPADLFHRPIAEPLTLPGTDGSTSALDDPLRHARAGSLYLHQHDVGHLLDDLADAGYDLVVFIDDIDRCKPATTAEVFEAVNLFLAGLAAREHIGARFVIGLDPAVVADHLDTVYQDPHRTHTPLHGDDPSPGWAYLRKLIQLPVTMPRITNHGLRRFLDASTASPPQEADTATAATPAAEHHTATREAPPSPTRPSSPAPPGQPSGTSSTPDAPEPSRDGASDVAIIPWRTLEQHPEIQELFIERLNAQPDPSIREAKRLLNLWQLYQRILNTTHPLLEPRASIDRARTLVLLADILTRWPALQRSLHQRTGPRSALRQLADHAHDDGRWPKALSTLNIDLAIHAAALDNLRYLLADHDAHAIADLADLLL
jgi:WD40 repeat protein